VLATRRQQYAAALALLLAGAAGCSSDDPDVSGPRPTAATSTTPSATEDGPPTSEPPSTSAEPQDLSPEELVETVLVTDADLLAGGQVETRPDGTQVDGYVTLDNCGFVFTSEADRTARRQVNMSSVGADVFSHEVVAYTDESAATAAIDELRESVRTCPSGEPVPSALSSVPTTYEVLEFDEQAPGFPVDDVAVLVERVSAEDYPTYYVVGIYQRAGNVLNAHYLGGEEPPTARLRRELRRQAMVTGARLAEVTGAAAST